MFVRPAALEDPASDEFLDFGGAVVGFFLNGSEGEICALSSQTAEESVWISSGLRVSLSDEGVAEKWMRVTIRLNQKAGRWDLAINGQPMLAGLRTVPRPRALQLWLYGDRTRPVQFDDVLVSNRPPGELEREFPREPSRQMDAANRKIGRQVVTQRKANVDLHQASKPLQAARGNVRLNDWHLSLQSGDRVYDEPEAKNGMPKLIAYAPASDEAGDALPVTVTITADASLEPGADLGDLCWEVSELLGMDEKLNPKTGRVIVRGNFRSGLVQTAVIPAEWARKATSVSVRASKSPR